MKKILLITTGGTIASSLTEEGLAPSLSSASLLHMLAGITEQYEVRLCELFQLDSSNIQPEEWLSMSKTIAAACTECDGIVITHGTDTMAYTASALSFLLIGVPIPVVLTGSQLPILHPLTDAPDNLRCAFAMAASGRSGVYVAFNRRIIIGARAVKIRTSGFDAFESVNAPYAGVVDSSGLRLNEAAAAPAAPFRSGSRLCGSVFLIKLTPGLNPEIFDMLLEMNYRGLVIEAFGAGGMHFIRRDLITRLHRLVQHGVAVVVCSQCLYERSDFSIYQAGQKALASGVIEGGDMTTEAAVTKLMWALAEAEGSENSLEKVKALFEQSFAGEITPES